MAGKRPTIKATPRTAAPSTSVADTFVNTPPSTGDGRRSERKATSIRLHPAVMYQAKRYVLEHGGTVSDLLEAALLEKLGLTLEQAATDSPR